MRSAGTRCVVNDYVTAAEFRALGAHGIPDDVPDEAQMPRWAISYECMPVDRDAVVGDRVNVTIRVSFAATWQMPVRH